MQPAVPEIELVQELLAQRQRAELGTAAVDESLVEIVEFGLADPSAIGEHKLIQMRAIPARRPCQSRRRVRGSCATAQQVSRYGGSHKHLWLRSSGMALGWLSSHTRLRYIAADKVWTLYWGDRDLRFTPTTYSRHRGGSKTSSPEIDRDPACIFWANPPSPARQRQFASPGPLRPTRWGRLGWTRRRCCQRKRGTRFSGAPLGVSVWLPVRDVGMRLDVNDPRVVAEVGREDVDRRGHDGRRIAGRGGLGGSSDGIACR
jgi:Protein of unknown function (DUF3024)